MTSTVYDYETMQTVMQTCLMQLWTPWSRDDGRGGWRQGVIKVATKDSILPLCVCFYEEKCQGDFPCISHGVRCLTLKKPPLCHYSWFLQQGLETVNTCMLQYSAQLVNIEFH